MKKSLLIVICLLSIVTVYGEDWVNNSYPESISTPNDITVTFNFPYNLDEMEVQSMGVEVEAYGVNDANAAYIKNYLGENEYLGALNPYNNTVTFTINNPMNYAYFYDGKFVVYLHFDTKKYRDITVTFYHINGITENITKKDVSHDYIFEFPWNPANIKKIDITINYSYRVRSVDCVYVDNYYVGALKAGKDKLTITTFNIDSKTASNILSDGLIKIKIDNNPNNDKITINKITVKVYYTNKPTAAINDKKVVVKTSVSLGVTILTLAFILLTTLKRIR
jgi:hypothetical protein